MKGCSVFITWIGLLFDLQHQAFFFSSSKCLCMTLSPLSVYLCFYCFFIVFLKPYSTLSLSLCRVCGWVWGPRFEGEGLGRAEESKRKQGACYPPSVALHVLPFPGNCHQWCGQEQPQQAIWNPQHTCWRLESVFCNHKFSFSEWTPNNTTLYFFPITAPDNNPEDVRSESTDPDTLVIAWEVHLLPECTIIWSRIKQ